MQIFLTNIRLQNTYTQNTIIMILFISLCFLASCSLFDPSDKDPDKNTYFEATYDMNLLEESNWFDGPVDLGEINNPEIDESSGMVVCRQDNDMIWTHNDSGDSNRIFLILNNGAYLGTFNLINAKNRDWEDIAIGPGPIANINYLYVAEIGDNNAKYDLKYIYRFPEPDISVLSSTVTEVDVHNVETITFVYPDGIKMDAETLLIDPWTKDLYIVTKREWPVTVYRLPYPQSTTETITAEKYGTLPFTFATAGDISADGKEILIKTYDKVFLWTREESESIADAFMQQPVRLKYTPEPQGEAITFHPNGIGYYTLSETRNNITPRVYFYRRKL
jgi:hypothetical protein